MQENRVLAPGHPRPREGQDEDGDPLVTSRAIEVREFTDEHRCLPCLYKNRTCYVKEAADSCIQCSATFSAHECVFERKIVRRERLNFFSWAELTGYNNPSFRNARDFGQHPPPHQAHRDAAGHPYSDPPRPLQYAPYPPPGHPPENHVERTWNSYPSQQGVPPSAQAAYNGHMPPPKRQRTDMYDGQDVFGHARQSSMPGGPPPEWQSPRRTEFHLPEIRPHEAPLARRPEDSNQPKDERPVTTPLERNAKALDLKPPSVPPSAMKRKLEMESQEMNLPHRCSKCDASFKTPAELKKHFARHEPQYFCTIPGCSRGRDGFTTKNDLDRHRKTMHKILSPNDRFWKCFYPDCAKTEKVWPRLDNFKAHIVRMHGSQYVQENVARAEEWWDAQKTTPMLGRSPETTHDLVAIEPKPPNESSRLGVTNLLQDHSAEQVNGRRRHLSAEGRQEAAQVREMGACLRCALLKEKCDDSRVCHRCNSYANKHFNGTLICRRGNMADYLVPLIPLFDNLPQPEESTKGWNLRSLSPPLLINTFTELLDEKEFPAALLKFDVRRNDFTAALFEAMDNAIAANGQETDSTLGPELRAEIEMLRQLRSVCCLLYDCVVDALKCNESDQEKANKVEKLQKTNLELREWYDELDNAVFDWKSRHLELNQHPMKKWNLFFSICAMIVMERLTVLLTRAWAHVTEVKEDSTDDEAIDTLCALLEFKFWRQTLGQHHFISMLMDDKQDATEELRGSMGFLCETKGFETWKWLHEQFGEVASEGEVEKKEEQEDGKVEDTEDSDTIQVDQSNAPVKAYSRGSSSGPSRNIRSRRSGSKISGSDAKSQNGDGNIKKDESPEGMSE